MTDCQFKQAGKKIIFNTSQTKRRRRKVKHLCKRKRMTCAKFIIRELGDIYQFPLSHI